jgi:hypothetical protein
MLHLGRGYTICFRTNRSPLRPPPLSRDDGKLGVFLTKVKNEVYWPKFISDERSVPGNGLCDLGSTLGKWNVYAYGGSGGLVRLVQIQCTVESRHKFLAIFYCEKFARHYDAFC